MEPKAEIKVALDFVHVEKFESTHYLPVDDISDGPGDNDIQSYELKFSDLGNDGVMISFSHPVEESASIILPSEKVTELVEYLRKTLCQQMPLTDTVKCPRCGALCRIGPPPGAQAKMLPDQHRNFRADRGRAPLSGPKLPQGV